MSKSSIPIQLTCPLGSKCEEVRDGAIHRCAWFTKLQGQNPSTGESMDEWGCAISWMPILSVEMSRTNRGQTAALESFRNEMVSGNEQMTHALLTAAQAAQDTKLIGHN